MAPLALGADSGGSIRLPASCCNILGLKASRGRVSLGPGARELWGGAYVNGPLARTVRDLALVFDLIARPSLTDPYCAASLPMSAINPCAGILPEPLRVAITMDGYAGPVDEEVKHAVRQVGRLLEEFGHDVQEESPDLRGLAEHAEVMDACYCAGEVFTERQVELAEPHSQRLWQMGSAYSAAEFLRAMTAIQQRSISILDFWSENTISW